MKKLNLALVFLAVVVFALFAQAQATDEAALPSSNQRIYERWHWRDTPIRAVFNQISMISGVDIVLDPRVTGTVNIDVRNRTWQDVFRILCTMNDLHFEKRDDFVFVSTRADYVNRLIQEGQTRTNLERVEELVTHVYHLQNTLADEMVSPVQGLLSQRGRIVTVPHTNSLIIHELDRNLPSLLARIQELDRALLQVSIEVKIVEVAKRVQNDIGVQWSFFNNPRGMEVTSKPGSVDGVARATFGILDEKGLRATLDYLFTESNSELVAEPHITTLENKEARIFMGSRVPITQLDISGNTVTELVNAGTELSVTPTITGAGDIQMALNPVKKSYEITDAGVVINEQGAETNVVVRDGETIVIGGLTADEDLRTEAGIPLLKNIPVLGFLFKRSSKILDNKDLVIFVTPRIIKSSMLDFEKSDAKDAAFVNTTIFQVE